MPQAALVVDQLYGMDAKYQPQPQPRMAEGHTVRMTASWCGLGCATGRYGTTAGR
jgi:hypothetical protein